MTEKKAKRNENKKKKMQAELELYKLNTMDKEVCVIFNHKSWA